MTIHRQNRNSGTTGLFSSPNFPSTSPHATAGAKPAHARLDDRGEGGNRSRLLKLPCISPGPWKRDGHNPYDIVCVQADEVVASVCPMKNDGLFESWKVNARAVEVIPDMLALMKELRTNDNLSLDTLIRIETIFEHLRGEL